MIFLFAKDAKPPVNVEAIDKYGSTALHMATYKGNVAAVKDLLECNADINVNISQSLVFAESTIERLLFSVEMVRRQLL